MATKTLMLLTDDLDGSEIAPGKGESIRFALDGREYQIDLTTKNAAALRKAFEPWLAGARKASGTHRARSSRQRSGRGESQSIREWAIASGYKVSARGRIPADIEAAYHAAP